MVTDQQLITEEGVSPAKKQSRSSSPVINVIEKPSQNGGPPLLIIDIPKSLLTEKIDFRKDLMQLRKRKITPKLDDFFKYSVTKRGGGLEYDSELDD